MKLIDLCLLPVLTLPLLTGCGPQDEQVDEGDETSTAAAELTVKQEQLSTLADQVEEKLSADPDFSSVALDTDKDRLLVYRKGAADDRTTPELLQRATGSAKLEFLPALWSKQENDAFTDRLGVDDEALKAAGVEVTLSGPSPSGGKFEIFVKGDATSAAQVLEERYPELAGKLDVKTGGQVEENFGRFADGPYHGGARLYFTAHNGCTSGFAAKNSAGSKFLVTAYHCVNPDNRLLDGLERYIGRLAKTDLLYDAAIYHANSTPSVWTDKLFAAAYSTSKIGGSAAPRVGLRICTSGSYTRFACTGVVRGSYSRSVVNNFTHRSYRVNVWYADATNVSQALTGAGDSGGPVIAKRSDGKWNAIGLIHAGGGTDYRVSCPDGANRACSSRVLFTNVQAVATRDGLKFSW
ncbi:MAG: S1 family peptidase [Myxococcaceae bacterium]|nr:S1 family peptidase [Myxococcaceae bacterium]